MKYQRSWMTILLGFAFLLQSISPLVSNAVLIDPLFVKGNMTMTLQNLASHAAVVHGGIFMESLTAAGIILLGTMLYHFLKGVNEALARFGFAMYVLEAVVVFGKQILLVMLLKTGQLYGQTGDASMLPLAQVLDFANGYAGHLNMMFFGLGAVPLYALLVKSRIIPRWLAIYGLATVPFILIATPLMNYIDLPFYVLFPYVPFEFVTGAVILAKGLRTQS